MSSVPRTVTALEETLQRDPGVTTQYKQIAKRVTPGESLELSGSILKWYGLHAEDSSVPTEIAALARAYLIKNPPEARGLGFVILHRCGSNFYFLLLATWRNNNELWETVIYKDGDAMADFAPFAREETHKPTFCVWELAPVWHETQAWVRFLKSTRDEAAAQLWLQDVYSGEA